MLNLICTIGENGGRLFHGVGGGGPCATVLTVRKPCGITETI